MAAAAAAVDENGGVGAAAIDVLMRGTPRLDAILRSGLGFRNRDLEKISKHKVCEALEKDLRSVGKGGLSSRTEDRLWGLFTCFREDLDVSTEVIRRMVLEYPQLLMLSESAPADTVHMLASDCGLKTSVALDLIAAIPALLTLKTAPRRKVAYLAAEVGLSPLSIAAMTAAQPAIFGQSLDGHLRPAISFFTSHLGLELSAVRAMVVRQPRLLSMSIENNLKPKVEYLMNEVGMSLPQVAKALASHPAVLCLSLDDNIAPTVGWLRAPTQREVEDGASPPDKGYVRMYPEGGLGLSREDTALLLSRQADVLCKSVTLNLKLKAEYFRQLGLTDEQLRQAVTRHPALLCLSVEHNIAPKIAFLQSEMALSSGGIAQLVAMHGNILTLSLTTNLRPKLGLFHDELGAQPDELAKVLMTNPRLLTASVERRILPRMAAMSARGLTPQFPHIRPITVYTDIMFERWLNSIAPAKPALAVAEGLEIGLEVASSNPNIMGGRLVFPSTLEPPTPDTDQLAIRGALSDNLAAPAVPSMIPFAATADGTGRRSGGRIRMLDALQPASKHSVGASVQETTAELGLKYLIPTPGASGRGPPRLPFLPGRQAARETARDLARNLRCLDLYSGTGGFALNCALGGASEVVAVEKAAWPSAAALSNARMNKLTPRVKVVRADVEVWVREAYSRGSRFGMVILDPPSFSKVPRSRRRAVRRYTAVAAAALALTVPGGLIVAMGCAHAFAHATDLLAALDSAAASQHKSVTVLQTSASCTISTPPEPSHAASDDAGSGSGGSAGGSGGSGGGAAGSGAVAAAATVGGGSGVEGGASDGVFDHGVDGVSGVPREPHWVLLLCSDLPKVWRKGRQKAS